MRKLLRSALAAAVLGLASIGAHAQVINTPTNTTWRWLAADPGTALGWTELNFDDSSWSTGTMPLGYPVGENAGTGNGSITAEGLVTASQISYYFRRTFQFDGSAGSYIVSSTNWFDDGAAVFINGQEVYRIELEPEDGAITHDNPQGDEHGDISARPGGEVGSGIANLVNGQNVIAVTLRNAGATSSDLVFASLISVTPRLPVSITEQPVGTNAVEGQTFNLSVEVSDPLATFQWFANDEPLESGTNATLTITNAGPADAGDYFVFVSNPLGDATSDPVTVGVNPLQITSPLNNNANPVVGTEARLTVEVNGPAGFRWFYEGTEIDPFFNATANSNTLVIPNIQPTDAGTYTVIVTNSFRTVGPATYSVAVSDDVVAPTIVSARANTNGNQVIITFSETLAPTGVSDPFTYNILSEDGSLFVGVITASQQDNVVTLDTEPMTAGTTYVLSFNSQLADPSGNALEAGTTATIATPRLILARDATWRFDATGTAEPAGWEQLGFDDSAWAPGVGPIGQETSTIPWPINTDLEPYVSARLAYYFRTIVELPVAIENGEVILTQSIDDGVVIYINGVEVSRTRMAEGDPGFTTQAIGGAVGNAGLETITLTGVNMNAGENVIAVEVHQSGNGSSDMVMGLELTAFLGELPNLEPIITVDPQPLLNVPEGTEATFTVDVDVRSGRPLSYQWFIGPTPITDATNETLVLTARPSQQGNISVQVSNTQGTDTSLGAQYSVTPDVTDPTITGVSVIDVNTVEVTFSENVLSGSGTYTVNGTAVSSATVSNNVVRLTLGAALTPGSSATVNVANVSDLAEAPNTVTGSISGIVPYVASGSVWSYDNTSTDLFTAWRETGFDDSAWPTAAAPLGTDTDQGISNVPITSGTTTYYFRQDFTAAPGITNLHLDYLVDDGMIVYLNGQEIHRYNISGTGEGSFTTTAVAANPLGEGVRTNAMIQNIQLLANNTFAVSVHQNSGTSSDMVFDLAAFPTNAPIDLDPATLVSSRIVNLNTIELVFSETLAAGVTGSGAENPANYSVAGNTVTGATLTGNTVTLTLGTALTATGTVNVNVSNVADASANANLTTATSGDLEVPYVPVGALWSYDNTGVDRGTEWRMQAYDDSAWATANGPLGTESNAGLSVNNVAITDDLVTYYFRHDFAATPGAASLDLEYVIDDGAIIYLNGAEIHRFNMPEGEITFTNQASAGAAENVTNNAAVNVTLLAQNTLAVEVHQSGLTSSDLVLQLEVSAGTADAPELGVSRDGNNITLTWDDGAYHLERTDSLTNPVWVDVTTTGNTHTVNTATGNGFFRLSNQTH